MYLDIAILVVICSVVTYYYGKTKGYEECREDMKDLTRTY